MQVLVLGGTGTVGAQVVRSLLAQGFDVHVLTRNAAKIPELPNGATGVTGDLLDPAAVRSVFQGMEGVFLLNAVSPTETHEGLMAVNGARLAGVRRLVYLSVFDLEKASHLPHFGSKLAIEHAVKASGIAYTILRPNNFFQNDEWFGDTLLEHGLYPQPIGEIGISRIDVRDIADAAVAAFLKNETAGQTYPLGGPEALTGPQTAQVWSQALDRPVVYMGNDLDAWEKQMLRHLPAWMVFDFRLMYDYFQKNGLIARPEDLERLEKLIGHAPRDFRSYARERAQAWKH